MSAEFEDLLVAHQRSLLRYIKSRIDNHHEAEDLLQQTNLILWRKRCAFEAGSNFRAWAFAIARLEIFNQLKKHRRDRRIASEQRNEETVTENHADNFSDEGGGEALVALRDCLKRLPCRDKELLLMRYGTDRTLRDYARDLDRSPGTLKARLFRIREGLKKSMEDRLRGFGQ